MRTALAAGCNHWNASEFYGTPENNSLTLLQRYYEKYPEDAAKVSLNVKGAILPGLKPDGSPEGVRRSVENSVKLLGPKGKIDMFECAVSRTTPLHCPYPVLPDQTSKAPWVVASQLSFNACYTGLCCVQHADMSLT